MDEILTIERDSPKEIIRKQERYLKNTIEHVYRNSKFYNGLFKDNDISPSDIKTLEDLKKIPCTTKEDIRKRNWDFLCVPTDKIVDMVASSGTTGLPIYVALTSNDTERLAINEEKSFLCAGTTNKDVFQLLITLDSMFTAGMAFYRGITRIGATALRVGPGNSKLHLRLLSDIKANGVVGIPSFMLHLGEKAIEENWDIESLNLEKGVFVGEAIRDKDMTPNNLGKKIEDLWGIELFSTYGSTEIETSFCECVCHTGLHLHPDLLIIEVVDENGEVVGDEEEGELVVTTLQTEGMPFLRYKTGDITFLLSDKCECGRTAPRIGPILGRVDHMMKVKGTNVYPGHIENALLDIDNIMNYVIEAHTGEYLSDKVLIKIGTDHSSENLETKIKENVKASTRMTPEIEFYHPSEIRKMQFEGGKRKAKKFIDKRTKKRFYKNEN